MGPITMNDLFNEVERLLDFEDYYGSKAKKLDVSYPSFPPTDVLAHKDGTVEFRFALAGYGKDQIKVSFEGDWMLIKSNLKPTSESKNKEKENYIYRYKGIKTSNFDLKYCVPNNKFNTEEAEAEFDNGILVITIPPVAKSKTKQLSIK